MSKIIPHIEDEAGLDKAVKEHASFCAVLFYKDSSELSTRALAVLEEMKADKKDLPLHAVDTARTRGLHGRFGLTRVPTLVALKNGTFFKKLEGLQLRGDYELFMSGAPRKRADGTEAPPLRVTVYSTPVCPHCTTVKQHLRRQRIPFRDVDVSRDADTARELQARSGNTGVPQTDINGTVVLGADLARIDTLLKQHA